MNVRRVSGIPRRLLPLRMGQVRMGPVRWTSPFRWAAFRDSAFNWPAFRRMRPLQRSVPASALMPYVAALATIVVMAVLFSYAARRVVMPWSARTADSAFAEPAASATSGSLAQRRGPATGGGVPRVARAERGAAATGAAGVATGAAVGLPPAIEELRQRQLSLPVNGVGADQLIPTFDEARGDRPHEAIDIMSPRGTPVVATEAGRIAKLFYSKAGGHTIYQFDPSERYVYYYAHLDRYADGLAEGQAVTRGQTIGYVGSTGNAKADAPHLHFAIFLLTPERRWWDGTALDPYPVLRWSIEGS
jgi:peptidoglycan LD-endopeptidase LytH